uniref:SAM-dependent methyltransferase TRM5/TYW2-type domain-containing protein n=2 Tax=Kalanchoe fedtschenkoi TaxID=63787 RepID=A0A7N0UT81_KALFE
MEFEKRKAATLSSLGAAETDKSPKGSLDTPIIPLLNVINRHPSYYTTSSCSGRISILSTPTSSTAHKKARGGSWLFITHDFADKDAVLDALFRVDDADASAQQCDVVFRFEPLIIAVECRDVASAQTIVSLAIAAGFRESGITSVGKRVIVGIRCSIRMEVPLGETGRVLVSTEYVEFLVGVANQKMEANRKRTDGFFQALLGNGFGGLGVAEMKDCAEINEVADSINGGVEQTQLEKTAIDGGLGASDCLPIAPMTIDGEPVERLFLWGHTACTVDDQKKVLVYGGFGGMGRHARRNDCLLLDPLGGALDVVKVENSPPPRLGHTASMVGKHMFVIGGRADPVNILNDVWVLDTVTNIWKQLECGGSAFAPRHRHAAAVVGSKIYIYGGLNNDTVFSSFHVLDTINLKWIEIPCSTDWPGARHSHAMVATESQLFIFGGCGTDKVLGELFSFDVRTHSHESSIESETGISHSFVLLERDFAKVGKDLLKKHGWLDLTRKAYSREDGKHICFPVTNKFCSLLHAEKSLEKTAPLSSDPLPTLCKLGATIIMNDAGEFRKPSHPPAKIMREAVASLLKRQDMAEDLLEELPARWERLGDIVVLPESSFKNKMWDSLGNELWSTVAKSLGARRLARQGRVASTGTRDSTLEILVGENGWVEHRENGIVYSFDATKCMFSWGNLSEKLRMAGMNCRDEVVVDLFAGIGYFVLPFLVRANAKLVYACEWNLNAIEALRRNLEANSVADRCIVLEGDNRLTAPKGVANRVNLGLLPTSELSWETAVRALRSDGGVLHVHANVKDSEENDWVMYLKERIGDLAKSEGHGWDISVDHVDRVKWYAPHIRHLVADVRCTKKHG